MPPPREEGGESSVVRSDVVVAPVSTPTADSPAHNIILAGDELDEVDTAVHDEGGQLAPELVVGHHLAAAGAVAVPDQDSAHQVHQQPHKEQDKQHGSRAETAGRSMGGAGSVKGDAHIALERTPG